MGRIVVLRSPLTKPLPHRDADGYCRGAGGEALRRPLAQGEAGACPSRAAPELTRRTRLRPATGSLDGTYRASGSLGPTSARPVFRPILSPATEPGKCILSG